MALSDESRALLQLLLGRGKDYRQIAVLLGIEPSEVRSRAESAVGELDGVGAPLGQPVTDHLLGEADPIARAEAARLLADDHDLAGRFGEARDQLALLFPGAAIPDPPRSPAEGSRGRKPVGPHPSRRDSEPSPSVEQSGRAPSPPKSRGIDGPSRAVLAALIAAVGLAAIIGVVVLLGGGGAEQQVSEGPPPPTRAILEPPEGADGRGRVDFGFAGNRFAANVSLSELSPNRGREGYALWLEGPAGSFPFDSARVGEDGTITGQSEISQAIICFIAADLFSEVKVSRVGDAELTRVLREAVNRNVRQADFPDYVGETVLSGPISMPAETKENIIEVCGGRNPSAGSGSPGS